MEKFLRDWRQDAMNKHQYESAIFVGDKLLALTSVCYIPHLELVNPF
jgi:anaphase-promoting complex subunit 6